MNTKRNFDLSVLKDVDIRVIQERDSINNIEQVIFLLIKRKEGIQSVKEFLLSDFNSLNSGSLQIMYKKNIIITNNRIVALKQLKRLSES